MRSYGLLRATELIDIMALIALYVGGKSTATYRYFMSTILAQTDATVGICIVFLLMWYIVALFP